MISLLLISSLLTVGQVAHEEVPQLREDNIKEVVAAMTPEEKCTLIIGGRAKSFNGIGHTIDGECGC